MKNASTLQISDIVGQIYRVSSIFILGKNFPFEGISVCGGCGLISFLVNFVPLGRVVRRNWNVGYSSGVGKRCDGILSTPSRRLLGGTYAYSGLEQRLWWSLGNVDCLESQRTKSYQRLEVEMNESKRDKPHHLSGRARGIRFVTGPCSSSWGGRCRGLRGQRGHFQTSVLATLVYGEKVSHISVERGIGRKFSQCQTVKAFKTTILSCLPPAPAVQEAGTRAPMIPHRWDLGRLREGDPWNFDFLIVDRLGRLFGCEVVAFSNPADPILSGLFLEILEDDWPRSKPLGPGRFIPNLGAAAN